jgi:hypothetical protein
MGDVWSILSNFGPNGLFIGYLIWRELRTDGKNMTYNQARLECDKTLASSLGALTAVIQRLDR